MEKLITLVIDIVLKKAYVYLRDVIVLNKKAKSIEENDDAKDRAVDISNLME